MNKFDTIVIMTLETVPLLLVYGGLKNNDGGALYWAMLIAFFLGVFLYYSGGKNKK